MPFGFGPRNCIGMRFALLETKLALMKLLQRYTFMRASDTEVHCQQIICHGVCSDNDPCRFLYRCLLDLLWRQRMESISRWPTELKTALINEDKSSTLPSTLATQVAGCIKSLGMGLDILISPIEQLEHTSVDGRVEIGITLLICLPSPDPH